MCFNDTYSTGFWLDSAILMAIAGYNPNEGPVFWERMSNIPGGRVPEFLSTHPSDEERMRQLRNVIQEAIETAARFGVHF